MPNDSRSQTRAAVLAASLAITPPDTELIRRVEITPIKRVVPRARPPLDLDAPIYRYRVACDGAVSVVHEPIGARSCRRTHRHR
ncbi:MAG TPA: hypothetical protein VJZ76_12385 [Thermoanaerobaculia bacterium]|nr:hypothetical protein [Thermoanaerobaculia bacterium]